MNLRNSLRYRKAGLPIGLGQRRESLLEREAPFAVKNFEFPNPQFDCSNASVCRTTAAIRLPQSLKIYKNYSGSYWQEWVFAVFSGIAQKQMGDFAFWNKFEPNLERNETGRAREGRSEMRREAASEKALNSIGSTQLVQLVL